MQSKNKVDGISFDMEKTLNSLPNGSEIKAERILELNSNHPIFNVLENCYSDIETVLPNFLIKKYNLLEKKDALKQIHFPDDKEKLDRARFSLIFEEFFLIQLKLALLREENNKNLSSIPLEIKKDGLVMNFINSLPFKLTGAQQRAVNEILNDLNSFLKLQ